MMLREYQQRALDAMWEHLDRHAVAVLPTGSGKSHLIAELCKRALVSFPGTRILVVCHVKELIEQNTEKILMHWPEAPVSIYCAGLNQKQIDDITVASIQSIHGKELPAYDLIVIDEAHLIPHSNDGRYRALFANQPQAKIVGLTATPYRMRTGMLHKGDGALFDCISFEQKMKPLIAQGYLCQIIGKGGTINVDLSDVHIRMGDFKADEMESAFDTQFLVSSAVDDILNIAEDRKSILIFASGIKHAQHIAQELEKSGQESLCVITGGTSKVEREESVEAFRTGALRILINVGVFTTGLDVTNIDCIVLLRATKSAGLYVQMVGRGLRISNGKKDCLLLDYGNNIMSFGPLDQITVDAIEKSEKPKPQRKCPSCNLIVPVSCRECPECEYKWPPPERREVTHSGQASDLDPFGTIITEYAVSNVTYKVHKKEGKPDSMKVTYVCGLANFIHEWVCFEHGGYARSKAEQWAAKRGVYPCPETVAEALQCDFLKPVKIFVKKDGKYQKVVKVEF